MKLYQRVISGVLIGGSLLFCGCKKTQNYENSGKDSTRYATSFDSLGTIFRFDEGSYYGPVAVGLSDMDGDGDIDVVLVDKNHGVTKVRILENRLPQKK